MSLKVTRLAGFGAGGVSDTTMIGLLTSLGHGGDTTLCLDAGDPNSYLSGQTWTDVSGGTAYNFFLGATASSSSDDPTFVSAGASSYFQCDGGDFFRNDTTNNYNTGVANDFHQNNALFTLMAWIYLVDSGAGLQGVFGNGKADGNKVGTHFFMEADEKLSLFIYNGTFPSPSTTLGITGNDTALSTSAWHFIACSIDEPSGSGGGFLYADGDYFQINAGGGTSADTFDATFSSPSAGAAEHTFELLSQGDGGGPPGTGFRLNMAASLDVALSKAQMDAVWAEARTRFGL